MPATRASRSDFHFIPNAGPWAGLKPPLPRHNRPDEMAARKEIRRGRAKFSDSACGQRPLRPAGPVPGLPRVLAFCRLRWCVANPLSLREMVRVRAFRCSFRNGGRFQGQRPFGTGHGHTPSQSQCRLAFELCFPGGAAILQSVHAINLQKCGKRISHDWPGILQFLQSFR